MRSQLFHAALVGLVGTAVAAPSHVKRSSMSGHDMIDLLTGLGNDISDVTGTLNDIFGIFTTRSHSSSHAPVIVQNENFPTRLMHVSHNMNVSPQLIAYLLNSAERPSRETGGRMEGDQDSYSGSYDEGDLSTRSTDDTNPLASLLTGLLTPSTTATTTTSNLLTNLLSGSLTSASNNPVASLLGSVVSGVAGAVPTSGAVASLLKSLSPTGTVASLLSAVLPTSLPNLGLTAGLNLTPGTFINTLVSTIQQGLQKMAALIASTKLTVMNVLVKPALMAEETKALAHGILFVTVESLLASSAGLGTVSTSPNVQASVQGIITGLDGLYSAVTGASGVNSALSNILNPVSSILSTATGLLGNSSAVQGLLNSTGSALNSTLTQVLGGTLGALASLGNATKTTV